MMINNNICIIDFAALICRFGYSMNRFYNKRYFPVGGLYGVLQSMLNCMDKLNADNIIIVFEGENNYKKLICSDYKQHRKNLDDFIVQQMLFFTEFAHHASFNCVKKSDYEADDVIGSLAFKFNNDDRYDNIFILTFDKDFYQLLTLDKVRIARPYIEGFYLIDTEKFQKKYNFSPESFDSFLALCGDASDNIKGVKGIGKVIATRLLEKYKSIYEIYHRIEEIEPKYKKLLTLYKKEAFHSLKLSTINKYIHFDSEEFKHISNFKLSENNHKEVIKNTIASFFK